MNKREVPLMQQTRENFTKESHFDRICCYIGKIQMIDGFVMRFAIVILTFMGLLLTACENVPKCAYDDSCNQVLPNLSDNDFSGEPYQVLTMKNRAALPDFYQIMQVQSPFRYPAGTVVVDTPNRQLYLIEDKNLARRYPIAVGKEGYQFEGQAVVGRKTHWPLWYPTPDMREKNPNLPDFVEGGADNPLGARAIYLYSGGADTLYRIHGNNEPNSIGHQASSGCIRMYNEDVIDLYDRVPKGAKLVVIGMNAPEGVKVDHIGTEEEKVEEVEFTIWEQMFYDLKADGASDQEAKAEIEKVESEAEQAEAEAAASGESFDLLNWLRDNAANKDEESDVNTSNS